MFSPQINARVGRTNKPKVWLKGFDAPLTDRPDLLLKVGQIDFRIAISLGDAFEQRVSFNNNMVSLREAYERNLLDLSEDLPGLVAASIILVTDDNSLIFSQRAKSGVDPKYAPGRYSPSCDEQWDPIKENVPHETVRRCLREEWNLSEGQVQLRDDAIRLVALGREWGKFWNTVLIYLVKLPCDSGKVLDCWKEVPRDPEAGAVGAVPINDESLEALLNVVSSRKVVYEELTKCGAKWCGFPRDNELHESTGAARVLFALESLCGRDKLAAAAREIMADSREDSR
jgi:hypothetical protein